MFAGFINLPLSKFEEWSDKLTGEDAILDAEKDVVVMCHHGMRCGGRYGIRMISLFLLSPPPLGMSKRRKLKALRTRSVSGLKGGLSCCFLKASQNVLHR